MDTTKAIFKIEDFNEPEDLKAWRENDNGEYKHQPTLILIGEGGCGKTQWVKAFCEKYNYTYQIVNEIQGLGLVKKSDVIFFDDLDLSTINDEQFLHLIETAEPRNHRLLYKSVIKPKGIIQVIALNSLDKIKHLLNLKQYNRRLRIVDVPKNFIINITINNITNIHYNNIFNNEEHQRKNLEVLAKWTKK
jgi:GTPase SAR1 family protein